MLVAIAHKLMPALQNKLQIAVTFRARTRQMMQVRSSVVRLEYPHAACSNGEFLKLKKQHAVN